MKITTALFVAMLVGIILITAPWAFIFHASLSSNTADWAAFGDYIGGVLSPLIAAFALIAFLRTISQQETQIKLLLDQYVKDDIWRVIEKVEKDFETALMRYPIKVHTAGKIQEYSGFDIVFNPTAAIESQQVMVNEAELLLYMKVQKEVPTNDPKLLAYEMFSLAAGQLNQLRIYVERHSEFAGSNAMKKYFQRKYKVPYERFVERGYLKEPWRTEINKNSN